MNNKGFTIVEILVAASIGLVILGAIYAATITGQRSSVNVERKVIAQQDARAALDVMALEIRMASCNLSFAMGIWCEGPAGTYGTISSNQQYKGIQEATTTSITIEMDADGSSAIGDGANEIIRYNYDTANQRITRSTNAGVAQPFLGNVAGQRDLRVVNNTAGVPLFRYYNGNGAQISSANLPASIPDIRRIEITLIVDTEEEDPNLGQRRRTIYGTSVVPRNHAISQ